MGRVACAVDGTERSFVALEHAAAFASQHGHDLVAFFAIDVGAAEAIAPRQGRIRAAREAAEFERDHVTVLKKYNAPLVTVLAEDDESIAEALSLQASEEGIALLAVGSRGSGGFSRRLLGGVTTRLLGRSSLPLLVTGPKAEAPRPRRPMIWLSDDVPGSAALARGLHPALAESKAHIVVLHLDTDDNADLTATRFETRLEALRRLAPTTVTIEGRIERVPHKGDVLPRILTVADELQASSFGLATSGHRLSHRMWGGSTALRLLGTSPIPLVVVPRQ